MKSTAKLFSDIFKFNPYHDRLGRFTTANGASSMTIRTRSVLWQNAADKAIQREKERTENMSPSYSSKVTGKTYSMPKLESEQAEQDRQTALKHLEQHFSLYPNANKKKIDEQMPRYLDETDPKEWNKRAHTSPSFITHSFISAKTRAEKEQEVADRKDHLSRMNAKERASGKRTQAHQRYIEYERSLKEKYRKDTDTYMDREKWWGRATPEERKMLQELDDARIFRNKRGQWQIAKSFSDILKFNPYHDRLGRFTFANGATSFTYRPGASMAHNKAVAREKERTKQIDQTTKQTDKMAAYVIDSNFITDDKKACVKAIQNVYQSTALKNSVRWDDEAQKFSVKRSAINAMKDTARKIMEKQEYEDTATSQDYYELHRAIKRTPIKISDYDKQNIPDWNDYRKRAFGNLTISNKGISIDSFYQELSAQFPHLFNAKRETSPSDQLEKLNEVLTSLKPRKYTLKGKELEDAADDLALQMLNGYFAVIKPGKVA